MKIEDKIKLEIEKDSPNLTNEIKNKVDWNVIAFNNKPQKKNVFTFGLKMAIACVFILSLAVILPFALKPNSYAYSLIIDVNPSILLLVDDNNVVVEEKALNKDAVVLLYKEKTLVGKNIDEATKTILNEINSNGLLKNTVKFSIRDKDGKVLNDKQNNYIQKINNFINNDSIDVLILSDNELDNIEDYYEKNNMNDYEKQFVDKFRDKLISVVNEKILDINNLITSLNEYNLDEERIIDNFTKEQDLLLFSQKYKYNIDFDLKNIKYSDIYDLIKELKDSSKDLNESLKDINEESDDYSELLETLFDIVKDELFEEED